MQFDYQLALSIMLGIGLAAACGLRVFLPLFVASVFAHFNLGIAGLHANFEWMGSWPAMIALGIATVVELLSYYIPFVDHALDVIAVPLSTVAGTLIAVSAFGDLPPLYGWGLALIAGGGAAGLISAGTAATRLASTGTTGGLGNSAVSTAETGGAIGLSIAAFFLPVVAFVAVLVLLYVVWRVLRKVWRTARS
ncbi:MAG: DUF4126 domain-containing protein [Flavobacteriales bacterium]|nr:DUF4126 domain-containing protein [Flavobacteriales bacterium]